MLFTGFEPTTFRARRNIIFFNPNLFLEKNVWQRGFFFFSSVNKIRKQRSWKPKDHRKLFFAAGLFTVDVFTGTFAGRVPLPVHLWK